MKNLSLSIAIALSAQYAYGQETSSETVTVTDSRIPYESAGVIAMSGASPIGDSHGCAEPTCGGTIDPKEPGGSSGFTNQASKNQRNKQAKQKVQKKGQRVAQPIKNTKQPQSESGILATLERWFGNLSITHEVIRETETPSGRILKDGTSCTHIDFSKEKGPNPCVQKEIDVEKVLKSDGTLTNQALVSFVIYDECYYAVPKKCGPDYITFIAENQQELNFLLNDALGENHF